MTIRKILIAVASKLTKEALIHVKIVNAADFDSRMAASYVLASLASVVIAMIPEASDAERN